jgi:cytochrome c biogenesis protein CcdA
VNLLLEGIGSTLQPCTLALIVPGLAVVLTAQRTAPWAVGGYLIGASVMSWMRMIDWVTPPDESALMALIVLAGIALIWWQSNQHNGIWTAAGAAVVGGIAALLWLPCVGEDYGTLLGRAETETWALFLPNLAYVVGLNLVLIIIAALPLVVPRLAKVRDSTAAALVGVVTGSAIAVTMALGAYNDVVGDLYDLSV